VDAATGQSHAASTSVTYKDTTLINALKSGKATEEQWSKFFIDEKEYKDWLAFNASSANADVENYEKWINSLKLMANQAYGDTSHYEEYYSEYEKIAELARKRERLEK
jgi:hypothetical protein